MPGKRNKRKRNNNDRNHHNSNRGCNSNRQGNTSRGGRGGRRRGQGGRGGKGNNNSEHLQILNVSIVAKMPDILPTAQSKDKHDNEQSNMVSKSDLKNLFQSSLKEMLTKRTNKRRRRITLKAMMNHWIWMLFKNHGTEAHNDCKQS
jgi:hypothetical protein